MKQEVYLIEGMHCAACSSSIERVTRKLDGVVQSDVNLATNKMTIVYDETKVTPEDIIGKVEKAGFGAELFVKNKPAEAKSETQKEEEEAHTRKVNLIGSIICSLLLMYVSMGQMMVENWPVPSIINMNTNPYNYALTQILLCIPILYFGRMFFTGGFKSLFHLNPNMDTLVAIGSSASFIYSLAMTYTIPTNPHAVHDLYFEGAGMVITFVMFGKYLESRNKLKTKGAITKLMSLAPDTATVLKNGIMIELPTEEVNVGDTIVVKAGAKVPLDGVVVLGESSIDESMLTGESIPIDKHIGDEVVGGSVNQNGLLHIQVTRIGEDTTLSQIIKFVEDAQGKKAPIAKIADKVAGVFVPVVMSIAVIAAIAWVISGKELSFVLRVFTSVLVIACPCALGLATPTAIIVGTGLGASNGILIRNGETLEVTHKTTAVVLDKTGTVTEGKPAVVNMLSNDETELIRLAASVERGSEHPLAKAITGKAEQMNISDLYEISEFENMSGRGIKAKVSDSTVYACNKRMLLELGLDTDGADEKLLDEGNTTVYVVKDNVLMGIIGIADSLKPTSKDAIEKIKAMGIKTILLTGDNQKAANHIAEVVGVDECIAEVLPEDKAKKIKQLQEQGYRVMMVGDGINDAVALTQADVGCAIGSGSDIAIESADIVLMKNDLTDVAKALKLSEYTIRTIKQNLFWAFCYNSIGIPIAAGLLYIINGTLLNPMFASFAMSLSSVCVVGNALRLRTKKL